MFYSSNGQNMCFVLRVYAYGTVRVWNWVGGRGLHPWLTFVGHLQDFREWWMSQVRFSVYTVTYHFYKSYPVLWVDMFVTN